MRTAGSDAPNGTVTAVMCAVESAGKVNHGDLKMKLMEGQFLMNVVVEGWQWCGCGQQEGHFLEFTLSVAVPDGYKISKNNDTGSKMPVKISLGTNDSFILVSSKVSK